MLGRQNRQFSGGTGTQEKQDSCLRRAHLAPVVATGVCLRATIGEGDRPLKVPGALWGDTMERAIIALVI
jgi:hypothetical protein